MHMIRNGLKSRQVGFAAALWLVVISCGSAPSESEVVGGKLKPYGIGLDCAPADQTCSTIWNLVPISWCGCTDYFRFSDPGFSRAKLIQIAVDDGAGAAPVVDVALSPTTRWPGLTPAQAAIARRLEAGAQARPASVADVVAWRKRPLAERVAAIHAWDPSLGFVDVVAALDATGM